MHRWQRILFGFWLGLGLATSAAGEARFPGWPDTDFGRSLIDLGEIRSGGPPKDGIPAIDQPRFDTIAEAEKWLDPREPVVVLELAGRARAYPLQILIYHEIVNDRIGERPVSVTFCPLCNAAIAFDRRFQGRVLDFGTTGLLRNSDLVMYDRQTESWWQQFSGRAIVGELSGKTLETLPAPIVAFADFRVAFPAGEVLNRNTGHTRPYGRNPYRGYDDIDQSPFLYDGELDPRLPPMERVLGVEAGGAQRLYPLSALREQPVINDAVGGVAVVVMSRSGMLSALDAGRITDSKTIPAATAWRRELEGRTLRFEQRGEGVVDRETGSRWDLFGRALAGPLRGRQLAPVEGGVHFAFAWLAFNPGAEIYREAGR